MQDTGAGTADKFKIVGDNENNLSHIGQPADQSRVLHFDEGEMPDDVPVTMDALPKLRELFSVSDGKKR